MSSLGFTVYAVSSLFTLAKMYLCVGNLAVDYTVDVTSCHNCLHHLLMCTHCQVPVSLLGGWLKYMHRVPSKGTNTKFHCPVSINKSKSKSLWHGVKDCWHQRWISWRYYYLEWMRSCASNEIVNANRSEECSNKVTLWMRPVSLYKRTFHKVFDK